MFYNKHSVARGGGGISLQRPPPNGVLSADQCHLSVFQGPSREPRSSPAPLLVVVVPALPQGAAVEFHVAAAAAAQDDPSQSTSRHLTAEVAGGCIDWRSVTSAGACCASASLSLARPVDGLEPPAAAGNVAEAIAATFKKATEMRSAELVPLCARAFYKCTSEAARLIAEGTSADLCKASRNKTVND